MAWVQANISGQALQPAISIGNHNTTDCDANDCGEGNLDVQYIMAMSPVSPTYHWYIYGSIGSWLREIASTTTIPLVLSVSYGMSEELTSMGEKNLFTKMAKKLGGREPPLLSLLVILALPTP